MKKITFLLLLLCIPLMACDGPREPSPAVSRSLVVCLAKGPMTLDPRMNIDAASYRVTQVMFNGLLKKGSNMSMVPDLAEGWTMENNNTWVFTIKKGVKFQNGRELTAEDVAYTFESILDPDFKSPKRGSFSSIQKIEVRDPYTVAFYTDEPFAPLLVNLSVGIVPAEDAKEAGENFATAPIGTGPFKFVSMAADQEVKLAAFEDYFQGTPQIRDLTFRIVPDDTTRYLELIKGNLDFVQNGVKNEMIQVVENKEEFKVVRSEGTNYEYLAFNMEDPILGNIKVRQAIAHAINVPEMISNLLKNLARPATGLLPPNHWAYEKDVATYDFDPEKAKKLLDEAGYPERGDQPRFKLTYKTSLTDTARQKAEIIQQQLKNVGIEVQVRTFDWSTLFADIKAGNFQFYSLQWVGISEPDIYYLAFHSNSVPPNGANRGHYINPELDALIEKGRLTLIQEERKKIYSKIQKIIARDLPYVSLWHPDIVVVQKHGLSGFSPYPDGDLSNLWKISWMPPKKEK